MHVTTISICQSNLRQHIVNSLVEDELSIQIEGKLKKHNLEKRYNGYHLEEDGILIYKNRIYIPNLSYLRRIDMDEIHKIPNSTHSRYQK